jgi:hypothetical protein
MHKKLSVAAKQERIVQLWTSQSGTKSLTAVGVLKDGFAKFGNVYFHHGVNLPNRVPGKILSPV